MGEMLYKTLGKTGLKVSALGFGTATLGEEFGRLDPQEGKRAVHYAIEHGINFFDTSPYYGRTLSETRLGEALAGGCREKIVLSSKAGRYDKPLDTGFDFSAQRIVRSVEESLTRLKTDWIDVYQLHDIEFRPKQQILDEALPTIQRLKQQGKVRIIGVTGYPLHLLREMIEAPEVDTLLSYCHYTLLNTTLDDVLTPVARQEGTGLINASPLHMGVLTEGGPPAWHPAPKRVLETAREAAEHCRQRGANIATLALQFALQHDYITNTLVGMSSVAEVEHNLQVVGTQPDAGLLAEVQEILKPVMNVSWPSGLPENYEPGAVPVEA